MGRHDCEMERKREGDGPPGDRKERRGGESSEERLSLARGGSGIPGEALGAGPDL